MVSAKSALTIYGRLQIKRAMTVVVAQGLVSGLFGKEDAVVVAVSGGFAVYRFRAALAAGAVPLLFYLINIKDIPTFRKIRYRYIVSHL